MISFLSRLLIVLAVGILAGFVAPAIGQRFGFTTRGGVSTTGGLVIIVLWWVIVLAERAVLPQVMIGMGVATLVILAVGIRDLRSPLGPFVQLIAQTLAALSVVTLGGVVVHAVTNPFGGLVALDQWILAAVPWVSLVVAIAWIVALMNAVNFLDGVDGLAASVSLIGFLTIAVTSVLPQVREPIIVIPALAAAVASGAFLYWNIPPARLYLGTPGAWFLGFLLATLSVQGSSKIATLSVVSAVPILDAAHVMIARIRRGVSPFRGDTTHLHHRLVARGWSRQRILVLYAGVSVLLAILAVAVPTPAKIFLLAASALAVTVLALRPGRSRPPPPRTLTLKEVVL